MKRSLLIITVTSLLLCNSTEAANKADSIKVDPIRTINSSKLTIDKTSGRYSTPQNPVKSETKPILIVKTPIKTVVKTTKQAIKKEVWSQTGQASWYGTAFHGRKTASGEPFDMYQFTAAHPTLPIGTLLKVTNLRNRKTVVVRVNDRGPYVGERVIDLSYSAAQVLGYSENGLAKVKIERVERESLAANVTPTPLF